MGVQAAQHRTQTPSQDGARSGFGLPPGPLLLVLWFSGLTPLSRFLMAPRILLCSGLQGCPLFSLACFCCCLFLNGFLWKLLPHHLVALSLEWGA